MTAKKDKNNSKSKSQKQEELLKDIKKDEDLVLKEEVTKEDETSKKEDTSLDKDDKKEDVKDDDSSKKDDEKKDTSSKDDKSKDDDSNDDAKEEKPSIDDKPFSARILVVTSGKGGVGKTTSSAAISTGLAQQGHKTCVIDFDVGLRNLDLIMGCERRVVFDLVNVIHNEAKLNQALIKDKHVDNLYILPASQTKDKEALTLEGVGRVLRELDNMGFKYIICDSPAGIESGALLALYFADEAIVTTNPEVSSVRDSDRIIGILNSKSRRAEKDWEPVQAKLLLTRYIPNRVTKNEMLSVEDVQELLTIPLLGVIPESPDVLKASNSGKPIILDEKSDAGMAYSDAVSRLLGKDVELRFIKDKSNFLSKLFGK